VARAGPFPSHVHQWSESQEGWTDVTCEGIGVVVVVVVFVVVLVVGLAVAVVVEMVLCIPKTKQIKCEDVCASTVANRFKQAQIAKTTVRIEYGNPC
jgi:hypothetical protein